jgi:radical SAM superfamily enzyme YgiQ (UPF0313 family)
MLDILICIIPKILPDAPTVGPSVLKAHIEKEGFTCKVVDFNIDLYHECKNRDKINHFYEDDYIFTMEYFQKEFNEDFILFYNDLEDVFLKWINIIDKENPKFVGLSLLSTYSLSVAIKLSELIKKHLPHIKIVWGGAAVEYGIDQFKENTKLIDHYVYGDGEFSIIELLKGNQTKGLDNLTINQIKDLNQILLPNYDDIEWNRYENKEWQNPVYITGSRGCVKRCTFCNVYEIWPEYKFRSGQSIANEIIYVKEKYNRTTFKFTDSLVNGSMKAFRDMLNILSQYRKTSFDWGWTSQWIIRSKTQSPEIDYALMKKAGCSFLEIGLESFSQDVRFHMGKKFTDEDMWWCLEMLQKHQIPHVLLMIVGYPTETEADHQYTLECVQKIFDLGWNTYTRFSFGNTLMLSKNQPLYKLIKKDLTKFESNIDWTYKDNDLETRIRRFKEVNDLIKRLDNVDKLYWTSEKALKNYDKKLKNELPNNRWDG